MTDRKALSLSSAVKPRRKSSAKAEQRAETMDQILDTAEYLFSKHGFYGVTLKDVAKSIGGAPHADQLLLRRQKKLFEDVFARRAVVTSERRMKALDDYASEVGESRPSRAHRGRSSIPTSTSTPKGARGGATMARWAHRWRVRPNGAPE